MFTNFQAQRKKNHNCNIFLRLHRLSEFFDVSISLININKTFPTDLVPTLISSDTSALLDGTL